MTQLNDQTAAKQLHSQRRQHFNAPQSAGLDGLAVPRPCAHPSLAHKRFVPEERAVGGSKEMVEARTLHTPTAKPLSRSIFLPSTTQNARVGELNSLDSGPASSGTNRAPRQGSKDGQASHFSASSRELGKGLSYSDSVSHLMSESRPTSLGYSERQGDEEDALPQHQPALKILLWMAGPCVALSIVNAIWAIISILVTIITQPIRLCANYRTFGQQLSELLGPTLHLQLRCIYSTAPSKKHDEVSYHTPGLFLNHLVSPVLSFALMFASWGVAIYWVCSAVVGDPAGQDRQDDGRDTVLGLRNWWQAWLTRSIVMES